VCCGSTAASALIAREIGSIAGVIAQQFGLFCWIRHTYRYKLCYCDGTFSPPPFPLAPLSSSIAIYVSRGGRMGKFAGSCTTLGAKSAHAPRLRLRGVGVLEFATFVLHFAPLLQGLDKGADPTGRLLPHNIPSGIACYAQWK